MVRYLVTGANGFIGSSFIKYLKCARPKVEVMGVSKKGSSVDGIEHIELDLASSSAISNIKKIEPDRIFHLAGAPKAQDWDVLLSANVATTINVLEAAKELVGVKVFVIGSAAVYGVPKRMPVEEDMKQNPLTRYALSMACRQTIIRGFASMGCYVTEGILFNPLGPGIGPEHAPGAFIQQIEEITTEKRNEIIVGNIDVKRDFIDNEDACRAFVDISERGKSGESYNVCSGRSHLLRELLQLIMDERKVKAKIRYDPRIVRKNEVKDIYGSNEKIKTDTGWTPKMSFEESVKKMLV